MAQKLKSNVKIRKDEFVLNTIKDTSKNQVNRLISGYIGDGTSADTIRIYSDISLNNFVEVPVASIVHTQERTVEEDPMGGSYVWVSIDMGDVDGVEDEDKGKRTFWNICRTVDAAPCRTEPGYHPFCKPRSEFPDDRAKTWWKLCATEYTPCRTEPGYHPLCKPKEGGPSEKGNAKTWWKLCATEYTPCRTEPGYHPLCKPKNSGSNIDNRATFWILCQTEATPCYTEPGYSPWGCNDRNMNDYMPHYITKGWQCQTPDMDTMYRTYGWQCPTPTPSNSDMDVNNSDKGKTLWYFCPTTSLVPCRTEPGYNPWCPKPSPFGRNIDDYMPHYITKGWQCQTPGMDAMYRTYGWQCPTPTPSNSDMDINYRTKGWQCPTP